jgi:hypothetical protein
VLTLASPTERLKLTFDRAEHIFEARIQILPYRHRTDYVQPVRTIVAEAPLQSADQSYLSWGQVRLMVPCICQLCDRDFMQMVCSHPV